MKIFVSYTYEAFNNGQLYHFSGNGAIYDRIRSIEDIGKLQEIIKEKLSKSWGEKWDIVNLTIINWRKFDR